MPVASRSSSSDWVIHLTKARTGQYRHWERRPGLREKFLGHKIEPPSTERFGPLAVLKEILRDGIIHGSGYHGKVRAGQTAVCFTHTPLPGVRFLAGDPTRFSHYGIAFTKQAAFAAGARPVVYLPLAESGWIPRTEEWRLVRFEIGANGSWIDWTQEREWRLKGDLDLRSVLDFRLLIWNGSEETELLPFVESFSNFRGFQRMECT
jgi:hypothetical protein